LDIVIEAKAKEQALVEWRNLYRKKKRPLKADQNIIY